MKYLTVKTHFDRLPAVQDDATPRRPFDITIRPTFINPRAATRVRAPSAPRTLAAGVVSGVLGSGLKGGLFGVARSCSRVVRER